MPSLPGVPKTGMPDPISLVIALLEKGYLEPISTFEDRLYTKPPFVREGSENLESIEDGKVNTRSY
ncbi:MAG: hypothetical protein XD80_1250 [Synergistales bacterium 53_16]|jgi:hypothetical protein|nr:MAG: hypothetical protein XD80_1250 [Synergistales bacterium 53_16]KUL01980.1 MAG: hypothetical protein XE12_0906 [Synergistales bacterium 54_9]